MEVNITVRFLGILCSRQNMSRNHNIEASFNCANSNSSKRHAVLRGNDMKEIFLTIGVFG